MSPQTLPGVLPSLDHPAVDRLATGALSSLPPRLHAGAAAGAARGQRGARPRAHLPDNGRSAAWEGTEAAAAPLVRPRHALRHAGRAGSTVQANPLPRCQVVCSAGGQTGRAPPDCSTAPCPALPCSALRGRVRAAVHLPGDAADASVVPGQRGHAEVRTLWRGAHAVAGCASKQPLWHMPVHCLQLLLMHRATFTAAAVLCFAPPIRAAAGGARR